MPDQEPPPVPKKRGCFFYGCITSVVLLFVVILGMFLVGHYFLGRLNKMVAAYTDTVPMTLPKSEMPPEQLKILTARVQAFHDAVEAHSNTPPLTLTGPEANALLGSLPELAAYKDKFFITFEGDQTKAEISVPLDTMPLPPMPMIDLKGRYLNGKGTFNVALTNGELFVDVAALEVKGQPVPAAFLANFQKQNLAQDFNKGTNAAALQQYESVQVKDSVLIVTPKAN